MEKENGEKRRVRDGDSVAYVTPPEVSPTEPAPSPSVQLPTEVASVSPAEVPSVPPVETASVQTQQGAGMPPGRGLEGASRWN